MTQFVLRISIISCFVFVVSNQLFAVTVSSISQLRNEINKATEGTEIIVENGSYTTTREITINDRVGTESRPIIIRAQTIGGVTIDGKDGFVTKGSTKHVIIKGFVFKHEAYHKLYNTASYCTFTRNVYECKKDSETDTNTSSSYLAISGSNNEVSYNTFQNKNFRGPMLSLQGSKGKISPNNWIHHNHFKDFTTSDADNDNSCIQPGYGSFGDSKANMIIEHNVFENLTAESEGVASFKCWDITFRYNTVLNCESTSLRSGEGHKIYGNYFLNSKVRFCDSNHQLYSNAFVGGGAGIILYSSLDPSKATGYSHMRPVNCFIGFNTFVKNRTAFISNGTGGSQDLKIVNNIFYDCPKAVDDLGAAMDGVLFDANIIWLGNRNDHPTTGLISKDPLFEYDSDGVPSIKSNSPAIDNSTGTYAFVQDDMDGQIRTGLKDIGADELGKGDRSVSVLSASQVGPNANISPEVSIVESNNGNDSVVQSGYSLSLKANASDPDGTISNVKLYIDDVFVREDSVAPYEWGVVGSSSPDELNGLAVGQHTITVVATDNEGLTNSASMILSVKVPGVPPSISFATPTDSLTVNSGYSLYLKADASDSDGSISNVKLYIDGVFVRQESMDPYEWGHAGSPNPNELNGLAVGNHTIAVVATDNGGYTDSASMVLTVSENILSIIDSKDVVPNVLIYPNPAKQQFTIESKSVDISEVAIYTLDGKLVCQSTPQRKILLIHERFDTGIYIIKISNMDDSINLQKIIVE